MASLVRAGHSNDGYGVHGPPADKLFVFPWQIYPDMVVFDWLIRLSDKDRYDLITIT